MQVPLQIVFEHIDHSDAIEAAVRKEARRLERFYDRITSARVVIDRPQHRRSKGDTYSVRIHLALPAGRHIDITREPAADGRHEDAYVTIRDAFDAAGRQLQDQARILDGAVKSHQNWVEGEPARSPDARAIRGHLAPTVRAGRGTGRRLDHVFRLRPSGPKGV